MPKFANASIRKAANICFDGKVTSISIILTTGKNKTLAVTLAGKYKFETGAPVLMEVIA